MSGQKRYELKFVLDSNELNHGLGWLYQQTHCRPRYRPRFVNSLYFDTPDFHCALDNLSGASRRYKARLRWYQDDSDRSSPAILEVKHRDGRLGGKQQFKLPAAGAAVQDLPVQEIPAVLRRLLNTEPGAQQLFQQALLPMLGVRYRREYFEDSSGLRVTLDRQVKFTQAQAWRRLGEGRPVAYPAVIMELKFPAARKDALSRQLGRLQLRPQRHSKYLTGLAVFTLVNYL